MAEVRWIKIVTNIFDDEKMLLIESLPDSDSIIVCWFKLLCLAGKQNNSGVLMLNDRIAYTDEMLATVFRRPVQTVRLALTTFEQFGMVEIINGAITIPNWGKHQNIEGMDKIREQNRIRKQNQREREKALLPESHVTSRDSHATEEEVDKDKEKDKEREVDVAVEKGSSGNQMATTWQPDGNQLATNPPTLEEVKAFANSRNSNIDPLRFYSYYSTGGWKDPKGNPIGNWKQKFIKWENTEPEKKTAPAPTQTSKNIKASCNKYPPINVDDIWKSLDKI